MTAFCSWCGRRATQRLREGHTFRRNVYRCGRCGERTLRCRLCRAMARGRSRYDEELCALHDGTLPSFHALPRSFPTLEQCAPGPYPSRWGMTATAAALGAVAAGRTPIGALLGGWSAARAIRAYLDPLRDFRIEKVKEGMGNPILLADGFLTQQAGIGSWEKGLSQLFPRAPWYRVLWGSQSLKSLAAAIGETAGSFRIPSGRSLFLLFDVVRNPWHLALWKAERTGRLLGFLLSRLRGAPPILIGHSLGARIVLEALQTLGSIGRRKVKAAHLLAAAVDRHDEAAWRRARQATGSLFNYFSRHDGVLRYLYAPGNLFLSDPAGLRPAAGATNVDASRIVRGHTTYSDVLPRLLHRKKTNPR